MAQRRERDSADVVDAGARSALRSSARIFAARSTACAPRGDAPNRTKPLAPCRARPALSGCVAWTHADRVVLHVARDRHAARRALHRRGSRRACEHRRRSAACLAGGAVEDRVQLLAARERTWSLKKKRSSCASGSGYVPSISSGFCVGEHDERLVELRSVRLADRHAVLLHRLEQRALRLRRGAVDLVGEHDVREDRALPELEDLPARLRVSSMTRGAEDVGGHQVGRELDARERRELSASASVRTSIVLPRPGTPSSERVTAGEQAR